jgi:predicted enzyme related to lactoylglutathione lyase
MTQPGLIILYVANPTASAAFYADLFGTAPVETSPNFVMFKLASGLMFGLWRREDVKPAAPALPAANELVIFSGDVDAVHADWAGRGVSMLAAPVAAEFGRSFVAADPDGHRLRVLAPA